MISTRKSLLCRLSDAFGINHAFTRQGEDVISKDSFFITSPVEATFQYQGNISSRGEILSKHGKNVMLEELIGRHAEKFEEGTYINLYLAPKNKHYFLLPYGGKVEHVQKNEGEALIPVFVGLDALMKNQRWFSKALKKNASIGVVVNTGSFSYAMIAVGSLNVNNIATSCEIGYEYGKGAYAGQFRVGSTIVLCLDKRLSKESELLVSVADNISIGSPIIKLSEKLIMPNQ